MATYADLDDTKTYLGERDGGDLYAAISEGQLAAAEADINRLPIAAPGNCRDQETGLKLQPARLAPFQATALAQAVAEQLAWRMMIGEAAMAAPDGDGPTKTSHRAEEILRDAALLTLSGTLGASAPTVRARHGLTGRWTRI